MEQNRAFGRQSNTRRRGMKKTQKLVALLENEQDNVKCDRNIGLNTEGSGECGETHTDSEEQ